MRLDGKKLRYLLEFFYDLYDRRTGSAMLASLRETQDALGSINDLRVQSGWLLKGSFDTDADVTRLAAYLDERERSERERFVAGFARFIDRRTIDDFTRFLNSDPAA